LEQSAERKPRTHREELTGSCRELPNEELHNLFSPLLRLITTLKSDTECNMQAM
jgi:hypothetical protein